MTLPSRRKPRTTPPSTPGLRSEPWKASVLVLVLALVAAVLIPAATAPAADWAGFARAREDSLQLPPARPWQAAERPAGGRCDSGDCVACAAWAAEGEGRGGPCDEADQVCRTALEKLFQGQLSSIDLDIRVGGRPGNDYPCECRLEGETYEPRRFATTTFTWTAAGHCHKPLYFEDWNLERYGHSYGPLADPFLSAAHFFVRLPALPYQMGVELPWECVYPLGYYRPGDCAPWTVPAVPISARGLAVQAATVTGLVFLFP